MSHIAPGLTLAFWWLTASVAIAQDVPQVISPLRVESDHNGVNIATGRIVPAIPVLSVPAAPNLRFDWVDNAAPYVVGYSTPGDPDFATRSYSIHFGGSSSESFQCVNTDCSSVTGTGSIVGGRGRRFRRAGSGELYVFNEKQHDKTFASGRNWVFYATNVTYPNGEIITYQYETHLDEEDDLDRNFHRPVRLSSNLGYHLTLSYQSDVYGALSWETVKEATIYKTSAPTVPLARLTYAMDGQVTDLAGRVFNCCITHLGMQLEVGATSLKLPGETAPRLQVETVPGKWIVGSVSNDGVPWTYSYQNLQLGDAWNAYHYTSVNVAGPNGYHATYATQRIDRLNIVTSVTDALNRTTSYTYSGFRPIKATFPELDAEEVEYDDWANIVRRTRKAKPGTGLADITERLAVAAGCVEILCYRPIWYRDALNRQTDYAYNARGQLIEQTDPADAAGVRRKTYVTYETGSLSRRSVVRMCGTGAACGSTDEIRTEYSY